MDDIDASPVARLAFPPRRSAPAGALVRQRPGHCKLHRVLTEFLRVDGFGDSIHVPPFLYFTECWRPLLPAGLTDWVATTLLRHALRLPLSDRRDPSNNLLSQPTSSYRRCIKAPRMRSNFWGAVYPTVAGLRHSVSKSYQHLAHVGTLEKAQESLRRRVQPIKYS